jgi:hypothetical protein
LENPLETAGFSLGPVLAGHAARSSLETALETAPSVLSAGDLAVTLLTHRRASAVAKDVIDRLRATLREPFLSRAPTA